MKTSPRLMAALVAASAAAIDPTILLEEGRARFAAQTAYDEMAQPQHVAIDLGDAPPTIFAHNPVDELEVDQAALHEIKAKASIDEAREEQTKLIEEANAKIKAAGDAIRKARAEQAAAEQALAERVAAEKAAKAVPSRPAVVQQPVVVEQPTYIPSVQQMQRQYDPIYHDPQVIQSWRLAYPIQSGGCANGQCGRR